MNNYESSNGTPRDNEYMWIFTEHYELMYEKRSQEILAEKFQLIIKPYTKYVEPNT